MGQSERLKAIVLRRTNYAEADRVLQLLTPKGRRSVIAKGVRRERSKLAGGIELLAICDVVIRSGRGDLGLLTSARLAAFYRHILEDYERMQFAYAAMKLVSTASKNIDEPEWYFVLSMWAPKRPVATSIPRRRRARATASTSGAATGPGAAAFQEGRWPLRTSA